MSDVLTVLARAPRAGDGKSRLRAALTGCPTGHVDALVGALVADTLAWARRPRQLVVVGAGHATTLHRLAPEAVHVAQPDAPFGVRIEHALSAGFTAGGARVVQIGTDSPTLPEALLDAAYEALDGGAEAALVPALDGGWVALGLSQRPAGLLAGAAVRWSTEHAAVDTVDALRDGGLRVAVLPPWYDIDGLDGLERLRSDLSALSRAPLSLAALARIDAARIDPAILSREVPA